MWWPLKDSYSGQVEFFIERQAAFIQLISKLACTKKKHNIPFHLISFVLVPLFKQCTENFFVSCKFRNTPVWSKNLPWFGTSNPPINRKLWPCGQSKLKYPRFPNDHFTKGADRFELRTYDTKIFLSRKTREACKKLKPKIPEGASWQYCALPHIRSLTRSEIVSKRTGSPQHQPTKKHHLLHFVWAASCTSAPFCKEWIVSLFPEHWDRCLVAVAYWIASSHHCVSWSRDQVNPQLGRF